LVQFLEFNFFTNSLTRKLDITDLALVQLFAAERD